MAAPATGEVNLSQESSVLHHFNDQFKSSKSVEVDLTMPGKRKKLKRGRPGVSQISAMKKKKSLSKFKRGKRRRLKPMKYGFPQIAAKKKSLPSKLKPVDCDPSSMGLSSQEENSASKGLKSPAHGSPAMLRAREVQSSLGTEHPSCIKSMVRSHVTAMGLPLPFCKMHLPKTDLAMVIEDENGGQYNVNYIVYKRVFNAVEILRKSVLSAGWRNYAVGHNLLEGDVLVFHLVEPCKFKVYIIRANDLNDVDGALSLLHSEAHTEQTTPDNTIEMGLPSPEKKKRGRPRSRPLIEVQKKQKKSTPPSEPVPPPQVNSPPIEHSRNDSEEVGSEVLEGSRSSKLDLSFQEVKAFEDFSIMVNGRCIDSELPDEVRKDYYKLCLAKKSFLHEGVPESLYYKLVAGMIGETVGIANEMKNCKVNITKEELEAWDNSLKSFQLLGMKVDFLHDRVNALVKLFESEGRLYVKRYAEANNEHKRMERERKDVEAKLVELKEVSRKFEIITDALKQKAEEYELKFKQEVDAPWQQ